ncbi:MAG: hypothetical protein H7335_09920 [Massilia sp.]|nr:hypothetical protein [Massilia sp.]
MKTEFTQLDALCTEQAVMNIVIANRSDDAPLDNCKQYKAAQGRLAELTLAVLDGYGKALSSLADDKAFDLSLDVKNIGGKLQGLKDNDGQALVNATQAGALTRLANVLVDVAVSAQRSAAIERMVQEAPNLRITGQLLKSFFVAADEAPANRVKAPYANLLTIIDGAATSSERLLAGPALRTAEPIRTAELLRTIRGHKFLLHARNGGGPDSVPGKIVAAIDAWQSALDTFSSDALKRDPQVLFNRLKQLHETASVAQDAVDGKSE